MILFDMLAWWYGPAWRNVWQSAILKPQSVLAAFSVALLAKTLWAPFRQIDAGGVRGPLGLQLRAWFDRTFSRFIGFGVRSVMIFAGCLTALVVFCGLVIWALAWVFIPIMPVLGFILMLSGKTL